MRDAAAAAAGTDEVWGEVGLVADDDDAAAAADDDDDDAAASLRVSRDSLEAAADAVGTFCWIKRCSWSEIVTQHDHHTHHHHITSCCCCSSRATTS
jgi:hypothetical protein